MRRLLGLGAAAFIAVTALSTAASAADRQYDCTKPGNANKAACKTTAKAAPAAAAAKAKPAKAAKAATAAAPAAKMTTAAAKPAAAERNYDCSKAGNKNKAACKGVAAAPAAAPARTATTTTTTTAKAAPAASGLATAAKSIFGPKPAPAATRVAKAPAAGPTRASATMAANAGPPQPGKPTATCKDGTPSMTQHRSGACAGHGGVATWLAQLP